MVKRNLSVADRMPIGETDFILNRTAKFLLTIDQKRKYEESQIVSDTTIDWFVRRIPELSIT